MCRGAFLVHDVRMNAPTWPFLYSDSSPVEPVDVTPPLAAFLAAVHDQPSILIDSHLVLSHRDIRAIVVAIPPKTSTAVIALPSPYDDRIHLDVSGVIRYTAPLSSYARTYVLPLVRLAMKLPSGAPVPPFREEQTRWFLAAAAAATVAASTIDDAAVSTVLTTLARDPLRAAQYLPAEGAAVLRSASFDGARRSLACDPAASKDVVHRSIWCDATTYPLMFPAPPSSLTVDAIIDVCADPAARSAVMQAAMRLLEATATDTLGLTEPFE